MRTKARRWLGVDGEGVGRSPHRYVLLACSDGDYVEDRRGLSTVDCLEFLLSLGTRDARVCGYFLSYDWTKILQDVTRADPLAVYALFRPELRTRQQGGFERVEFKRYRLHWLASAMWIRDDRGRHVTVWDLGKYYQGPFVEALQDWKIRPDVQKQIAAMKKRRSRFKWSDMSQIRKYCMQECQALSEFGTKLELAHTNADLTPRSWYGPGSTASVLLNRHDIGELRGIVPPTLLEPVACAFFGGRAEISTRGYVQGPIAGYDISSAYPYHASRLPCLLHGQWEKVTRERSLRSKDVAQALVHGRIENARGAWCPLPVRLPNDTIVFPQSGASGWWWRDEWLTARRGWGDGLKFEHAYVLRRECDCKPFAFVPAVFDRRNQVGKNTGEGRVLKLAINSVYGKLAQTVGAGQYASRVWAGMITSGTRAQVLDLMLRHKRLDNILMIATDGLYSRELHDVDFHAGTASKASVGRVVLGGWERDVHESMTLVRPGIYWLGKEKLRARGIGRANLSRAKKRLQLALEREENEVWLAHRDHFGGAKQCIREHNGEIKVSEQYGEWHPRPGRVSLSPTPKRREDWSPPTLTDVESAPYGTQNTRVRGPVFEYFELLHEFMD